ncbi:zinc finger protein 774-like [Entelurus aequoreus]|uniref:zinc finger protein 774-like n=1 Tax=Entelurus aequoreus TaxID=161455 RepID=UPI002B1E7876|nr:zinc finger protein 774-like [Entelurus aequoreus]
MCKVKQLRMLMEQRLNSVIEEIFGVLERTIAEYEEELSRTKEKTNRQQKLLDAVFKPRVVLRKADNQHVSVKSPEEIPSQQQEWRSTVGEKEREPNLTEEKEKTWEQTQRLEEEEDDDDNEAQFSQLHHSQSEECRGAELLTQHIADGELCEDINSEPDPIFAPLSDIDGMMSDSSESDQCRGAELLTQHIADGEHGEDINSEPDSIFAPLSDIGGMMSDSSESNHSDDILKPLESTRDSKRDVRDHTYCKHFDCGSSFRHRSLLTTYKRTHTVAKPFACSVCQKSFYTKNAMTTHTRSHMEMKFPCWLCNERFKSKHHAMIHMRTHAGEKLLSCNVCCKKFTLKGTLKTHTRREKKPFLCSDCAER